jgi:prepilin-type N-terminal cleavage/methylation domain-containing protein
LRDKSGFTLVEVMIVVAIIGLLVAIAIPNFRRARTTARLNSCQWNIKAIQSAIERYSFDNVIAESALIAAISNENGWWNYLRDTRIPSCSSGTGDYTFGTGTVSSYTVICPNFAAGAHEPY